MNALKFAIFIGLFAWLFIGLIIKDIYKSGAISLAIIAFIFLILLQAPLVKRKKYGKLVEAQLPFFVMQLATEIRIGKDFRRALEDSSREKNVVSEEYARVVEDLKKGAGLGKALNAMNARVDSELVKRVNANLANLQLHGKKDVTGLKKIAQELLSRQRIESKEFSSKMVMYALVFVAVSAIVPAMFMSFVLVGSYFMKLSFSAEQVFLMSVGLFPLIDVTILGFINSKTPAFLKNS